MKTIQFVLSILVSICAVGMLYGAITTYSPMKIFSITIMSVICVGCGSHANQPGGNHPKVALLECMWYLIIIIFFIYIGLITPQEAGSIPAFRTTL